MVAQGVSEMTETDYPTATIVARQRFTQKPDIVSLTDYSGYSGTLDFESAIFFLLENSGKFKSYPMLSTWVLGSARNLI